jgi:hypothetical protein
VNWLLDHWLAILTGAVLIDALVSRLRLWLTRALLFEMNASIQKTSVEVSKIKEIVESPKPMYLAGRPSPSFAEQKLLHAMEAKKKADEAGQ